MTYSTAAVARRAGIHTQVLLFWLRNGIVTARKHPRRQWDPVVWSEADARAAVAKAREVRELRKRLTLLLRGTR